MAMPALNALDHQLRDNRRLAEQRAHEPSMEEILASIRRIIADDDILPLTPRPLPEVAKAAPAPSVAAVAPIEEAPAMAESRTPVALAPVLRPALPRATAPVLERLKVLEPEIVAKSFSIAPLPAAPLAVEAEGAIPVAASGHSLGIDTAIHAALAESFRQPLPAPEPILSSAADASVTTSFQALASSIFMQNTGMIEDSIRDMLRPMLKSWLDDNLPTLVERLVRIEIERVARGGR